MQSTTSTQARLNGTGRVRGATEFFHFQTGPPEHRAD